MNGDDNSVNPRANDNHVSTDINTNLNSNTRQEDKPTEAKRPRLEPPTETMTTETRTKMNGERVISQGAEAVVSEMQYLGRQAVRKQRSKKRYRHRSLDDKLRSRRLAQEARILLRLKKCNISVPSIYEIDMNPLYCSIIMQHIPGVTLKQFLISQADHPTNLDMAMKHVGCIIASMHKNDIVHGDLTTSNILVDHQQSEDKSVKATLIDFGLSFANGTDEDFAVDLYVFERAVIATHAQKSAHLNSIFFEEYRKIVKKQSILTKLEDVRARGRKRDMVG